MDTKKSKSYTAKGGLQKKKKGGLKSGVQVSTCKSYILKSELQRKKSGARVLTCEKKRKGVTLPLYFGYGLKVKVALVKLSSEGLNFTSKIFKKRWKKATVLVLLISIIGSSFLNKW